MPSHPTIQIDAASTDPGFFAGTITWLEKPEPVPPARLAQRARFTTKREEDAARAFFKAKVKEWKSERDPTQMTAFQVRHPAYRAIIELGWRAVGFLLEELKNDPDQWFFALAEITSADPYKKEERGRFSQKVKAWLRWGRENGLID